MEVLYLPKYYAGYYKRIDKEARTTKFIEVLIDEKPESKRDVADGRQPETPVETDTLEELGANRRVEQPAPRKN